jgi:hypothetical protein
MQQLPLVVSFYTLDTPYEEEVKYLQASCKDFDIDHIIEGVPSRGSWEMNCAFKPLFILQKMMEYQRPLLWVDADAVFVRPLEWTSAFLSDIGIRLYDCPDDHPSRIVTATLFAGATKSAFQIIEMWAKECLSMLAEKERQEVWDQDALRRVYLLSQKTASFAPLPPMYSKIVGHPEDEKEALNPIILQYQASRRYKRWISHPEERILGL